MQTGPKMIGQTGHAKNCSSWAEYELPNSSTTAALCNGGVFQGDRYERCDSIQDCLAATERRTGKRILPILRGGERPFVGSTVVGATPSAGWGEHTKPWAGSWPQASLPTKTMPSTSPGPGGGQAMAWPLVPPKDWPQIMQTPYVAPHHGMAGVSPTFIPGADEGIFGRLARNVAQGMIAGGAWQVFDYSRSVDMFGRR